MNSSATHAHLDASGEAELCFASEVMAKQAEDFAVAYVRPLPLTTKQKIKLMQTLRAFANYHLLRCEARGA